MMRLFSKKNLLASGVLVASLGTAYYLQGPFVLGSAGAVTLNHEEATCTDSTCAAPTPQPEKAVASTGFFGGGFLSNIFRRESPACVFSQLLPLFSAMILDIVV